MISGRSYTVAKAKAQAAADLDGRSRWLFYWHDNWWINCHPLMEHGRRMRHNSKAWAELRAEKLTPAKTKAGFEKEQPCTATKTFAS